jgi:hypothetical protein
MKKIVVRVTESMMSSSGAHNSGGNIRFHIVVKLSSDDIQLFLRKKTMDQPLLTLFKKKDSQQTVVVPPTSGKELNRFDWLVFRPQAHAIRPFDSDQSARQEKYINSQPLSK